MKNCHNCIYLEYVEADFESFDDSGFCCNGRDYHKYNNWVKAEQDHLNRLQNESYRLRQKKCCELQKESES